MVSDTTFAPATFAFPPFFAALRLIAVGLVVVGATVTVRPPTVSSVDAAPSSYPSSRARPLRLGFALTT